MKKIFVVVPLLLISILILTACGGGAAAPANEPVVEAAPEVVVDEAPAVEEAVEEPAAEAEPADEEPMDEGAAEEEMADESPAEEAPAEDAGVEGGIAGRPVTGIDPVTGFEINPLQVMPGVDYVVIGTLSSFNLTPQESPEFMVLSPEGTRYRIQSQPVPEIFAEDGSQLAPHEYQRGMFATATVRLDDSGAVTSVVLSNDFMLLSGE